MRYIILSLLVVFLSGCVTTKVPAKSEYRVNTQIEIKKSDAKNCKDKSLKVAQAFSSGDFMSHNMMYALGDAKQYAYTESLWAQNPNNVITSKFLQLIRETELFKSVQTSKSRSRNDFILEIDIEDFMQYFNAESTHSYANVSISLTLIDLQSNKVFATNTFTEKVDVNTLNAEGGVRGLTEALSHILKDTNRWMSEVCK